MADYIKVTGRDGNVYEVPDERWMGQAGPEEYIEEKAAGFMAALRQSIQTWMSLFPNADPCVRGIIAESIIATMCEYPHGRRAARYAWKLADTAELFEHSQQPNPTHGSRRSDDA
jgi:hypothetical protein